MVNISVYVSLLLKHALVLVSDSNEDLIYITYTYFESLYAHGQKRCCMKIKTPVITLCLILIVYSERLHCLLSIGLVNRKYAIQATPPFFFSLNNITIECSLIIELCHIMLTDQFPTSSRFPSTIKVLFSRLFSGLLIVSDFLSVSLFE